MYYGNYDYGHYYGRRPTYPRAALPEAPKESDSVAAGTPSPPSCFPDSNITEDIRCRATLLDEASTNSTASVKAARVCCETTYGGNFTYSPGCGFQCSASSELYISQRNDTGVSGILPSAINSDWLKCAQQGTNVTLKKADATCKLSLNSTQTGNLLPFEDNKSMNVGVIVLIVVAVLMIGVILACWRFRSTPKFKEFVQKIKTSFAALSHFKKG